MLGFWKQKTSIAGARGFAVKKKMIWIEKEPPVRAEKTEENTLAIMMK